MDMRSEEFYALSLSWTEHLELGQLPQAIDRLSLDTICGSRDCRIESLAHGEGRTMLESSGRVIMVSGANRGIGLATARHLSELGYSLSLGAREPAAIPEGEWLTHEWQATDAATGEAWVQATLERFGRVDGVVMNAGIELGGALLDGSEEQLATARKRFLRRSS